MYIYIYVSQCLPRKKPYILSKKPNIQNSITRAPYSINIALNSTTRALNTRSRRALHSIKGACGTPIADRAAQFLENISKTFPTSQNSVHGIYD